MKWKTETVLTAISAVCQFYYISFATTSIYLALTLTLPEYCADDVDLWNFMTLLVWFIFINVMGNFVCIIYKAKLSIVTPLSNLPEGIAKLHTPSVNQERLSSEFSKDLSLNNNEEFHYKPQTYASFNDVPVAHNFNKYNSSETLNGNCSKDRDVTPVVQYAGGEILGGWSRCKDCLALTPPRGKHCPLCKRCILKRDHHCYFVGRCIGFHNQRFFICFCLYCGLAGFYSLWLTSQHLYIHYEALRSWGRLAYFGPFVFVQWVLGYTQGAVFGMVMFWWWSLFTSFMGFCYFFSQMMLVIRGQTKYEFSKEMRTYRGTVMANVYSVFGKFWLLGFFIPAPFLGYVGDGANWNDVLESWKNL